MIFHQLSNFFYFLETTHHFNGISIQITHNKKTVDRRNIFKKYDIKNIDKK